MTIHFPSFPTLIIYISLTRYIYAQPSRSKIVTTSYGKLEGRITYLNGFNPVEEYLGVPYASPPIGHRRFMLPNTAAKWSSIKDATRLAPVCIQMFDSYVASGRSEALKWIPESYYIRLHRLRTFLRTQSEDCLYLNIHVPQRKGNDPQPLLPVLVLVHGGSFAWGTGNAYNASILASYGQIIVVTLNYRLGLFGFLSAGYMAPSCRGNWALGDIAAALEFIRQTIQDFNGDKNRITLLGWDTGAALVNLLMSSPVSAPSNGRSFQRAILLGGSALSSWALVKDPAEVFSYVAQGLSCPPFNTQTGRTSSSAPVKGHMSRDTWQWKAETESLLQDMTDCIASASTENITKVASNIEPPTYLNVFGPTVDGSMVINDPKHTLEQYSDLFAGLDLMIGMTKLEAFHLLANHDTIEGIDRKKRDQIYRTLITNLFKYHRNEILSAVQDEYTDWQSPTMHQSANIRKAVLHALGDALYVAPNVNVARLHSRSKRPFNHETASYLDIAPPTDDTTKKNDEKRGSTFMYVFTGQERKNPERGHFTESVHNEDLAYILGYPLLDQSQLQYTLFNFTYGNTDRTLAEAMMRYVSNFVKSGDPNRPFPLRSELGDERLSEKLLKLDWPQFEADIREAYVEIGENPLRDTFYRAHEVAFWNKFLPSLERAGRSESNERHHQFPVNSTYYGIVRATERYAPFVPPPLPPTPIPPALQAKLQEERIKNQQRASEASTPPPVTPSSQPIAHESYSTILSVTVAVGCALLTLNILIFAGIYHQWDKHKRFRKQQDHAPHYDLSSTGIGASLQPVAVLNSSAGIGTLTSAGASIVRPETPSYNFSSPLAQQPLSVGGGPSRMPPAPPPPNASSSTGISQPGSGNMDNDLHPTLSSRPYQPHHTHHHGHPHQHQQMQMQMQPVDTPGTPHGIYAEQEPLLSRSFISPTCPRHGKQAAAAAAAAMAAMEEIQV